MKNHTTKTPVDVADEKLFDNWIDPIETELRTKVRGLIEAMIEEELEVALARPRYGHLSGPLVEDGATLPIAGHRHDRRMRSLTGTIGRTEITFPRARIFGADGKTAEWKSKVVLSTAHPRRRRADCLGLSLRNQPRRGAPGAGGPVWRRRGEDTVSRAWRKVKGDWDAWNAHSLAEEPFTRLILDGTVARVRLDKKSTSISLLIALGDRQDGEKVLLAVKNMGGESEAAWRALLDDLVKRGLKTPELVIITDGAPGLEKALAAHWPDVLVQRCTVHKHRNLLAHAPERLHEEISADYKDMIHADTKQEVQAKRKAFIRKWRLKCPAVAASLEGFRADHNAQSRWLAKPQ